MMNALSIRNRLLAAFGLMLVLLMAVAAVGGVGIVRARHSVDTLINGVQTLRNHSDLALRGILNARVAEQAMLANNLDTAAIARHKKVWDAALADSRRELSEVRSRSENAGVREGLDRLARHIEAYQSAFEAFYKNLADSRFPDTSEAVAAMGPVNVAVAAIDGGFVAHQKNLDAVVSDIESHVTRLVATTGVALALALSAAVGLGAVLALTVTRSIVKPLAEAQAQATRIAAGDLTQDVSVQGHDEAAQTLQSLQQMTEALRRIVGEVRQRREYSDFEQRGRRRQPRPEPAHRARGGQPAADHRGDRPAHGQCPAVGRVRIHGQRTGHLRGGGGPARRRGRRAGHGHHGRDPGQLPKDR
jgi:methyl-accepting chemotaxis protein